MNGMFVVGRSVQVVARLEMIFAESEVSVRLEGLFSSGMIRGGAG
jgi:hypothetical protein